MENLAIVTDTHCIRLSNRIGLVDGIKGSEESRDGTMEDHPSGRRTVSSAIVLYITEEKSVQHGRTPHCEQMLSGRYL